MFSLQGFAGEERKCQILFLWLTVPWNALGKLYVIGMRRSSLPP